MDNTLELSRFFAEEIMSLSLHPSGHFLLAGFGDKLRLMNLLMEDIRPVREFSIRECKECRFSNGGHLFAAAQGNIIQVRRPPILEPSKSLLVFFSTLLTFHHVLFGSCADLLDLDFPKRVQS